MYFHSVTLDDSKCKGCTNCIKRCPTEAIRVRAGKAKIIDERCIDCGECIKVCPYHAKKAITDSMDLISQYKFKVAIPAPTFYGQFTSNYSRDHILTALKQCGFDMIYEVAKAAQLVSQASRQMIEKGNLPKPIISSACPAIVRLIQVRFPNLIDNILKIESPMETAAKIVKENIAKKNNISVEDIGVFFISPCAAKVTSVKAPYERAKSYVDGVIAIKDIFLCVYNKLHSGVEVEKLAHSSFEGISWATVGGESSGVGTERVLSVDGIHNVIKIFEEIANDNLEGIDFIEALSCTGGCLGGPLNVNNPYIAKTNILSHIKAAQEKQFASKDFEEDYGDLKWETNVEYKPVLKLDQNRMKAIEKLEAMEKIIEDLPGLDCGACGAPSCRALAEDIVREQANITDCIIKMKERVSDLAEQMVELERVLKPNKKVEVNEGN